MVDQHGIRTITLSSFSGYTVEPHVGVSQNKTLNFWWVCLVHGGGGVEGNGTDGQTKMIIETL